MYVNSQTNAISLELSELQGRRRRISNQFLTRDTDEEESETMDTTEQDRNEEACLLRTRMEDKFKEIVNLFLDSIHKKAEMLLLRDN
ncbi:hypothetical protein NPIL_75311 [Nephila pilipes]|uniref:Uncharacterized protein n=1 Tax=Nephila pilipes TaxID=299642 RepID=A0A8X6PV53_NEPPI|nr:hypothetical protein NPIL_75311 [Nephila pilipes]